MSEWKSRKFWTDVGIEADEDGWHVLLDGRPIKTPFKSALALPTESMARMVAREWEQQEDQIRPDLMPATRMANSAIDKVAPQWAAVVDVIAAYGETDLLCYRAEAPEQLVALQTEGWDPLLNWATETFGIRLRAGMGVIPVTQDQESLSRLRAELDALDPFSLTAIHDLVSLTGSLILGLAVDKERLEPDEAWRLSRIDEDWQISQWGHDEEAAVVADARRSAFLEAHAFLCVSRP